MVFQQFNLFPHMTALQNVMEGLLTVKRRPGVGGPRARSRALAHVGLSTSATPIPASCPAASSSASRLHARSRWSPK
jgi:ABC-type polar amino acid transport system ATPase subunit